MSPGTSALRTRRGRISTFGARIGALVLLVALSAGTARADEPPQIRDLSPAEGWPAHLPRFRATEAGLTLSVGVGLAASRLLLPRPPNGWRRGLLFDDQIRDFLGAKSGPNQERWSTASDWLQNIAIVVPFAVDLGVGALAVKGSGDLAWQMALIDVQALVLTTSIVGLSKGAVGRVRPHVPGCTDGGYACRSHASRQSFLSGHSTAAFAAAGLSCVHHLELGLFGGGWKDELMCATMLGVASTTAVLRVASDKHWATDTVLGAATGLLSGYLMPYLLHYQGKLSWPGMHDGTFDGSLSLAALGGILATNEGPRSATGLALSGRVLSAKRWLRLEGALEGRLQYDNNSTAVRDIHIEAKVWASSIAFGAVALYRIQQTELLQSIYKAAGPTLSLGTFDEDRTLALTVQWLLTGQAQDFRVVMRWSPWRHLLLSVEGSRLSGGFDNTTVTAAALGLGARLPW